MLCMNETNILSCDNITNYVRTVLICVAIRVEKVNKMSPKLVTLFYQPSLYLFFILVFLG